MALIGADADSGFVQTVRGTDFQRRHRKILSPKIL
jgi:hypothetical protein